MAGERSERRWTDGVSPARNPFREHDACGVGFVAHPRDSSHRILRLALGSLAGAPPAPIAPATEPGS
jgi:hypothetical protein